MASEPRSGGPSPSGRKWYWVPPVVGLVVLAAGVAWVVLSRLGTPLPVEAPTFDGSSTELTQTVIVPTLDTPLPEGKSVIWCSSFQLAWNQLKDMAEGPIRMENADEMVDRLNRAEQSADDLPPGTFYAAAGRVRDGTPERIRKEMARAFPEVTVTPFDLPPDGAVAYAYLKAGVRFETPFFQNDKGLPFRGSGGERTDVRSFGIREQDEYKYERLRQQVEVLYARDRTDQARDVPVEFALDLCSQSTPSQLVVARVGRAGTLAETLAGLHKKMEESPPQGYLRGFGRRDTLVVPNMSWGIDHDLRELQGPGRTLLNPALAGGHISDARQRIEFRLDRGGAELAAEAAVLVKPSARHFRCDGPFLVYLKKRDARHPFFVLWVENTELLQKY